MASDLERLVLQVEANTRGLERSLKRVESQVGGSMNRAARSTRTFNAALGEAAVAARGLFAVFAASQAVRGAQSLVDTATRIENALKVAGLSGEELTAVYDQLYAAAQKNAAPLESLAQLYSRVATVQNELGVSTQEMLSFTENVSLALRVAGTDAQTASGALLQLSQAMGAGVVRAEEFNSILEGALPVAQAAAAGLEEAGGSVAKLRQLVIEGEVSSQAFFRAFEAGAVTLEGRVADAQMTVSQQFQRLQNVLIDTAKEINEGTNATEDLGNFLVWLSGVVDNIDFTAAIDEINRFYGTIQDGIGTLNSFALAISNMTRIGPAYDKLVPDYLKKPNPLFYIATGSSRQQSNATTPPAEDGSTVLDTITVNDTVSTKDFPAAPSRKSGSGGGRSSAASEAEKQAKAIDRVIESLKFEQEQLGRTDEEQRLYNELKRAGVDVSSEAGQQIAGLVSQIEQEEQAMRRAAEASEFFSDLTYDAFRSIVPAIETGNQALDRLINSLIEAAAQAVLLGEGPLAGLLGGGVSSRKSGGGFGGLLGGLFGGFFADGGRLGAGKWGIAGEAGPEIVHGPANITPMSDIGRKASEPTRIIIGVSERNGNLRPFVESVVGDAAPQIVGTAVSRSRDSVVPTVGQYQRDRAGGDYRLG